jgi:hypothetical protein
MRAMHAGSTCVPCMKGEEAPHVRHTRASGGCRCMRMHAYGRVHACGR